MLDSDPGKIPCCSTKSMGKALPTNYGWLLVSIHPKSMSAYVSQLGSSPLHPPKIEEVRMTLPSKWNHMASLLVLFSLYSHLMVGTAVNFLLESLTTTSQVWVVLAPWKIPSSHLKYPLEVLIFVTPMSFEVTKNALFSKFLVKTNKNMASQEHWQYISSYLTFFHCQVTNPNTMSSWDPVILKQQHRYSLGTSHDMFLQSSLDLAFLFSLRFIHLGPGPGISIFGQGWFLWI